MSKFIQSIEPDTEELIPLEKPYQYTCPRCGATQPVYLVPIATCNACMKQVCITNYEELLQNSHKNEHIRLHKNLDTLLADFITHTGKHLLTTNLMEFLRWSFGETLNPTEK